MNILKDYLASMPKELNHEMLTFTANIDMVARKSPTVAKTIVKELQDQRSFLKLIASENFCSLNVQSAMGNLLTDKYAEGYVENRFYAGCDNVDDIERKASEEAVKLFGAEHAFVQPHSGADANLVAFWAILRKKIQAPFMDKLNETNLLNLTKEDWDKIRTEMGNQKMLGMDLYSGGHLTHGYRHNASAQMFDSYFYTVDKDTERLDYDAIRELLKKIRPLVFLIGFSAYTRNVDFELMKKYADEVGAVLMVDMAHFAGLVAGGVMTGTHNPIPYADIVTTTTHKTLRGPRGGMVLCKKEYAEYVDKACPHIMGGPLPHMMAAKAIAFQEANEPEFKAYAANIVKNAAALGESLVANGMHILTGGTDNHMVIVNVSGLGLTGRQAENALRECGMTLNRNTVPFDKNGPWYTSGLRFGTPAATSLGMGTDEMKEIGSIIANVLKNVKPTVNKKGEASKAKYVLAPEAKEDALKRVKKILEKFVLYPNIDTGFFAKYF